MSAQLPARRSIRRQRRLSAFLVLAIVVTAGMAVLMLHYRSGNPNSAYRQPAHSGSTEVAPAIAHRAEEFLDALRSGDEGRLRAISLTAYDSNEVASFVRAFGRRDVLMDSLHVGEFGDTGNLELVVPCRSGPVQRVIVLFRWKRTSFISSGWYAIINAPGTPDVQPKGCPAP